MKKYIKLLSYALLLSTAQATMHDEETLEVQENGPTLPELPFELQLKILEMSIDKDVQEVLNHLGDDNVLRASKAIRSHVCGGKTGIYEKRKFNEKIQDGYLLSLIPTKYYSVIKVRGFLDLDHLNKFHACIDITRAHNVSRNHLMGLTSSQGLWFFGKIYHHKQDVLPSDVLNRSLPHGFDLYAIEDAIYHSEKVSPQERADAHFRMAMMKFQGIGTNRDLKAAQAMFVDLNKNNSLSPTFLSHVAYQMALMQIKSSKAEDQEAARVAFNLLEKDKNLEEAYRYEAARINISLKLNQGNFFIREDLEKLIAQYYSGGDFEDLFESTRLVCLLKLASMTFYGFGGDRDFDFTWNTLNSIKNNKLLHINHRSLVQSIIAEMYEGGWGCERNEKTARHIYSKVAANTYIPIEDRLMPMTKLADMQHAGRGGPENLKAARNYYEILVDYENKLHREIFIPILFKLGQMYYFGEGGTTDYISARICFQRIQTMGHDDRQDMSEEEWINRIHSKYFLANMYYEGLGGDKNLMEALNLYTFLKERDLIRGRVRTIINARFEELNQQE